MVRTSCSRRNCSMKHNMSHAMFLVMSWVGGDSIQYRYGGLTCIAGTLRYAELKPNLPASMFPAAPSPVDEPHPESSTSFRAARTMNTSRRRSKTTHTAPSVVVERINLTAEDLLGDIDDMDMLHAADDVDYHDVEDYSRKSPRRSHQTSQKSHPSVQHRQSKAKQDWEPTRFGNGRWACNHKCKDKNKFEGTSREIGRMLLTVLQMQASLLS